MTSLTRSDVEYINNFYVKDGEIEIKHIEKRERLCVISIPVIDEQEDITDNRKIITIPIDYHYDGEDVNIYNVPDMLDDDDIISIMDEIWEAYN